MPYLQPGHSQDLLHRRQEIADLYAANLQDVINELRRRDAEALGFWTAMFVRPVETLKLTRLRIALGLTYDSGDWVNLPLLEKILTRARQDVAAAGGRLSFVNIPYSARVASNFPVRDDKARLVEALVKRLDIPYFDTTDWLRSKAAGERMYMFAGSHLGPAGNAALAAFILQHVLTE